MLENMFDFMFKFTFKYKNPEFQYIEDYYTYQLFRSKLVSRLPKENHKV